jgi:hypothetical protein
MKFTLKHGTVVEVESLEALEVLLRRDQGRDHDIYGYLITLPDTYSKGNLRLLIVDNTQYSNMVES